MKRLKEQLEFARELEIFKEEFKEEYQIVKELVEMFYLKNKA